MTLEKLATLRAEALAAGRALEFSKTHGLKMREIVALTKAHRAAWTRFYAAETRLRNQTREAV